MKKKAWSGRFKESTDKHVEEFNASIGFDKRLFSHDIRGSIAHASLLVRAGILKEAEAKRIIAGLKEVEKEIAAGKLKLTPELEDIHMAVESRLTEKIGPLGGKLHTGRSRNDQVAVDIRLYLKDEIFEVLNLVHGFKRALVEVAGKNLDVIMPGYTHLQRAQPVLFSHHLLAYYEMFKRDTGRLLDCLERMDEMPLGAGALAGSPYPLDRKYGARLLGFARVTENSLDSVSDRDFIIEFLSAASIIMTHFSRLSEEIILWSSQEFGFIELSDAFSTGSSIMPQKKNPDVAELSRGKAGRVYGHLVSLLAMMKSLPLAYNKDMQEDKEPLFDTVDTLKIVLKVYGPMLGSMKVNSEKMLAATGAGFLNATDAADYLVRKGMPFREAHEVAGRAVGYCIGRNKTLEGLDIMEWKALSPLFGDDIKAAVSIKRSLGARKVYGGTALETVKKRLKTVRKEVEGGCC
ncbi:MAG TPA: argininosuccinate lyase [Deltaproteobacteria bacterium]|nr:MAG: argininosuccinate lyase [Deltaproteobacteria bacterium GWA2_55_82]OGQ62579.1 MAG: argininosuccinate lyase [Deltaproteobacteria bacterium RIFCSPLOWO2_02_FULL_55_12]OIJ74167.1 MAG: argininosuccinate lyase [Deltaproteobacteria bacterium GWC2_55_46]HBG46788.1 argininosuccinate lyase [Deltaproteobacteria bacterium]HCY11203.1 argininosuccinate lyase [Deltaproteobacteria bacterium]